MTSFAHSALQFSGGKDSLAVAQLLRKHAAEITVYWVKVPEQFPETVAAVEWCKSIYPRFAEVETQVYGLASDIVPETATPFGRMGANSNLPPLVGRYECCYRTIMEPLAARMVADGVKLVIRGQKASDKLKGPLASGDTVNGIEYLYPLQTWTDADVFAYLEANNVPIPRNYTELAGGLDCPGCSAWWNEGKMAYLKKHHPLVASVVTTKLTYIKTQLAESLNGLEQELSNA